MNSKFRNLKRYVLRKDGRVGLRALARRYRLAPCTVSRYLNRNEIKLAPRRFLWEDWSNARGKEQAQKCRRALALFLLDLNREQIERLLGIKSETLSKYIRCLCDPTSEAFPSLRATLDKAYGMEDHLDVVADWIKMSSLGLPISTAAITRAVKKAEPTREFFVRKLRQILRRPLQHGGAFVRVAGRDGGLVKLRLPSVN